MRRLFGTDGVRGRANTPPMTAEIALRLGAAVGTYFRRNHGNSGHGAIIGKDTRRSGYMLETALTAGLTSAGLNVMLLGPVPTPAVGFLTRSMRADLGIMISASHNPAHDNGIKFFGPDGFKLCDASEAEIEALMADGPEVAAPEAIGQVRRIDDGLGRYEEYAKTTIPTAVRLSGLKVVVDCAHGAAYRAAPTVLWELGAEVVSLGVKPDGQNINLGCGSTDTAAAVAEVRHSGADIGICLDGDADRVILIDEHGTVADGDQVLALLAGRMAAAGTLRGGALVTTVMSNLGLERHVADLGLRLERTAVGDRYVVERMRAGGFNLGGEQSGHVVMTDHTTTGDGLIAALQVLTAMAETGARASELLRRFEPVPQRLVNVRLKAGRDPLDLPDVARAVEQAEARLAGQGRLLIRKSGTEPLLRVMAECDDPALLDSVLAEVTGAIEASAAVAAE